MYDFLYIANTDTDWSKRHNLALFMPVVFELPIIHGICGWIEYVEQHKKRYETLIGDDYVLGPAWKEWGLALRTLLNGDTGRLDCGTLDSLIHRTLAENGFEEE